MLRSVFALIFISLSIQAVTDICSPLTVAGKAVPLKPGEENLQALSLTMSPAKTLKPIGTNPFQNIWMLPYGLKKEYHILKVGVISGGPFALIASTAAINTNFQMDSGIEEGNMLYCQYHENHVYVLKTIVTLKEYCQTLNRAAAPKKKPVLEIKNDVLVGDVDSIPDVFDQMKLLGKGSFGTVRKFVLKDNTEIAIKSGSMLEISATEIKVLKEFNDKTYGTGFKGCFLDVPKKTMYIAQELMSSSLGSKTFLESHRAKKKSDRIDYYIQIAMGVTALQKIGYNHNDLKPSNIMADLKGNPHLVDFGFARKLGTYDNYGGTKVFCPPIRIKKVIVWPEYESFSLALTFLVMESPEGEKVMESDPDTGKSFIFVDPITQEEIDTTSKVPEEIDEDPLNFYRRLMRKILIPVWGKINEEQVDMKDSNFQSLIWQIVTTPSLPRVEDFVNQLKVIKAGLVSKKERIVV